MDTIEIQKIIRNYFENIYYNKIENLEDINKFLETYDLPKLNQEGMHNLNIQFQAMKYKRPSKAYQPRKAQEQMKS